MSEAAHSLKEDAGAPSIWWQRVISGWAQQITAGRIAIHLPGNRRIVAQGEKPGPDVTLEIRNARAVWRMLISGDIGFFRSYLDGDWTTPDLKALLELAVINQNALAATLSASRPVILLKRLWHRARANTRRGSRKNISFHYDMGNEFYRKWLDPTMTYSSAVFTPGVEDLEKAQLRKYHSIAERIGLSPGQDILEIGCGWGGFATVAARDYGCNVTCITLSKEQKAYAEKSIIEAGLTNQVEFQLTDYRDVKGQYDKIVSIEMFEAVGEEYWQNYFDVVRARLKQHGQALLQIIFINDKDFNAYRRDCDFIQRYVFPGGMLPSGQALKPVIAAAGLTLRDEIFFGQSYAKTLRLWRERFENAWEDIKVLGFDERFYRLWTYYLSYCEAGFATSHCNVGHYVLEPA